MLERLAQHIWLGFRLRAGGVRSRGQIYLWAYICKNISSM